MGPKGIEDLRYKNPPTDAITKELIKLKLCQQCKAPLRPGPKGKKFCSKLCRWKSWSEKHPRMKEEIKND